MSEESEMNKMLGAASEVAASFWNYHVGYDNDPHHYVLRVEEIFANTIARTYQIEDDAEIKAIRESQEVQDGTLWKIEVNKFFLKKYYNDQQNGERKIVATMIHEIGHILGIGGEIWRNLFDDHGVILEKYAIKCPSLKDKRIGHDGHHWEEGGMDYEIMTENQDSNEYVLPETIDVMGFLEHQVKKELTYRANVVDIIDRYKNNFYAESA